MAHDLPAVLWRSGIDRISRAHESKKVANVKATMATQTPTRPEEQTAEEKIQELRALFADAPEVGKKALENVLRELKSQVSTPPPRTPGQDQRVISPMFRR